MGTWGQGWGVVSGREVLLLCVCSLFNVRNFNLENSFERGQLSPFPFTNFTGSLSLAHLLCHYPLFSLSIFPGLFEGKLAA